MRWLVELEDDPTRARLLSGGPELLRGAVADGMIGVGEEDRLGLAILGLHEKRLIFLDYGLLLTDLGPEIFRGQPAYHLQQAVGVQTLPDGRDWVREPGASSPTFNISGSHIAQLAGRDIHNTLTFLQFVENLERAVDETVASEEAKKEARGLLAAIKRAARTGASLVHETGVELLAKVIAEQLNLPPG